MPVSTTLKIRRFACLLVLLSVAGCGPDGNAATGAPAPDDEPPTIPADQAGKVYYGQEIWLTYLSPPHARVGRRMNRSKDEARRLAGELRRRVEQGESLGNLAREHSNAPGGMADGYFPIPLTRERAFDHRDRAVLAAEVGELTPIVDWQGGFWFARRVSESDGRRLQARFETLMKQRVKLRVISIVHTGLGKDVVKWDAKVWRTHFQASQHAQKILDRALAGENFADLARKYSENKETRAEDGLLWVRRPGKPKTYKDFWMRWGETYVPPAIIEAAFATEPGQVYPKVIDDPHKGLFLIQTVEVKLK